MKVFWQFLDMKILYQIETKGQETMNESERNRYSRKNLVSRDCGPAKYL